MKLSFYSVLVNKFYGKKKSNTEPASHALKAWKHKAPKISFSNVVLFLTLLFLFIPLIVIIVFSFNKSKGGEFTGLSLIWYKKLIFDSGDLWSALFNSLIIAVASGLFSTVLGTLASLGISWYKFKGRSFIKTISFLPMVLPEVIIGVSMLIFFTGIHLPLGLFTIFVAHTTFCLPFVYLMVSARLDEFDFSIIEAAHDLGATESQTMIKIIIPAIMPGIISGFLMAITMSLEDFVITFFVSGPGSTTLPLYVYSMIRFGVSPVINSLSFIMILCTCLIAFVLRGGLKSFASSR